MAREILDAGGSAAIREAVQINAGAALWLYGTASDIADGYARARAAFENGSVAAKLEEIKERSNELAHA